MIKAVKIRSYLMLDVDNALCLREAAEMSWFFSLSHWFCFFLLAGCKGIHIGQRQNDWMEREECFVFLGVCEGNDSQTNARRRMFEERERGARRGRGLPLLLLPACGACLVEEEEFSCLHRHCNVSEDSSISPAEDSILKAGYLLTCCWLRQIQIIISKNDDRISRAVTFVSFVL